MKATGIVRRVDDLGRVVIPKEIRRNLKIREGDPLELFVDDGGVMFKPYSPARETNLEPIYIGLRNAGLDCAILDNTGKIIHSTAFWATTISEKLQGVNFRNEMSPRNLGWGVGIYPIVADGEVFGHLIYSCSVNGSDALACCGAKVIAQLINKC